MSSNTTAPLQQQAADAVNRTGSALVFELAERWKMQPTTMIKTIKATVFPQVDKNKQPIVVTDEQLMMFLQVAHQYDLNPFLKEIYAFPTKTGGIVPMVPVDGWTNIINRHPQFDGVEFIDRVDQAGKITAITCIIYRKDRTHPTSITEYMSECFVSGDYTPWKTHPNRMLRHKTLIQCGRVAFSLTGIHDPDEGQRIVDAEDQRELVSRPKPLEAASTRTLAAPAAVESIPHEIVRDRGPEPVEKAEPQGVPGVFAEEPEQEATVPAEKAEPQGPYVEKYQKLFTIAAAAGIKVKKDDHTDQLHQVLREKWGILSVKKIPVVMWDHVCEEVGKSLAVKQS